MKRYSYSLTTNSIWTSFDFGEIEASNLNEAKEKAIEQITYDFNKANEVLDSADVTAGFKIEINIDNLIVEEI